MPRLRILYDIEGWAYHRRALALQRYAPPDYEVTLAPVAAGNTDGSDPNVGEDPPDLLFCLVASHIQAVRQALSRRGWTTPLIGAWTSGWPLRIWQYYEVYDHADLTIVNNRDCWVRTGKLPGTTLVPNGVDHEVFHVRNELSGRTPKVLWTGSRFHSHVKGYDSRILPLLEALRDEGIPAESLLVDSFAPHKRSAEEMATWYNQGTVLVCASETEGTPNPCLEAAACGCTLVSTSVGNMPELIADGVNGYLVEPTVDALLEGVRKAIAGYTELAANMQRDIEPWYYRTRAAEFFRVFDQLLDRHTSRQRTGPSAPRGSGRGDSPKSSARSERPDLSDEVTVFVSTVGAPSYPACRQMLEVQDCTFDLQLVENVAPMSAAFQQMLDRCTTPFYVQVDEDMLLYPHAIRWLWSRMRSAEEDVAIWAAPLLDAHLRRKIYGVKIFRHEIVRDFPHVNVEASEAHQVDRLQAASFQVVKEPLGNPQDLAPVLGLHGTHFTPTSIFERYATLERKRRRDPTRRRWLTPYPAIFLDRYLGARAALASITAADVASPARARLEREGELDLWALLGCLEGSRAPLNGDGTEKDFRAAVEGPATGDVERVIRTLAERWSEQEPR